MNLLHIRDILGFWKSVKSTYNKQHPTLCTSLTDQLFLGRCEEIIYQLQNTPINQGNDSTQVQHRKAESLLGERLLSNCDSKAVTLPHLSDESWKFRHYSPTLGQPSTFTNTRASKDQVCLRDRRACRGILNKDWVTFYKRFSQNFTMIALDITIIIFRSLIIIFTCYFSVVTVQPMCSVDCYSSLCSHDRDCWAKCEGI